jgi:hypothetical protein
MAPAALLTSARDASRGAQRSGATLLGAVRAVVDAKNRCDNARNF